MYVCVCKIIFKMNYKLSLKTCLQIGSQIKSTSNLNLTYKEMKNCKNLVQI